MNGVFRKTPAHMENARGRTALAVGGVRKGRGGGGLRRRRSVRALREGVGALRKGTHRGRRQHARGVSSLREFVEASGSGSWRHDAPPASTTARP